ncbi:piggyBac transposable element-derived protein 4-like, partial [Myzus persicae]|uniref:piggyBac transposable element-derived protein 4-like n=1 Tax=Myzus persicae TaxID=13164 RepID=UPI000B937BAA
MIREEDIVRLLGTGLDSDLSSLSSDEDVTANFPDRELENLLDDFDNDFQGLADFLVEIDEADEQIEIEPEASQVNEQINESVVPLDLSFQPIQNTTSFTLGSDTNNKAIPKENSDKFVKIRPLYNSFIKRCAQLPVEQNLSVDEQIVPFKGNLSIKQYIRGKPSPWGIKNFLLCGQSGLVYNLLLYQGSSTQIDENMQKNFGLGGAIVLKLYKIFAAGTIRINRFNNPPFPKDKQLAKMGRGTSFEICSNHNIALVKWFDNKAVQLGSNFISSGTPTIVQRFDRKKKSLVFIECPEVVYLYNKSMGGVDKHDQLVSYYRTFIKSKKWTLRMLFHIFDMAVVNSWLEYKRDAINLKIPTKEIMDLIHFKQHLAESLIMIGSLSTPISKRRGRPSSSDSINITPTRSPKNVDKRPLEEVRKDQYGHHPEYDDRKEAIRCKFEGCTGRTHVYCIKCGTHLCFTKK